MYIKFPSHTIQYLSCLQYQFTDAFTEQILSMRAPQLSEKFKIIVL
jgi:hypothetical protein